MDQIINLFPLFEYMKGQSRTSVYPKILSFLFPFQISLQIFAMFAFIIVGHNILVTIATVLSAAIFALSFNCHWAFWIQVQKSPKVFEFEADVGTGYYPHLWVLTNILIHILLLGGSREFFFITFICWLIMIIVSKVRWK